MRRSIIPFILTNIGYVIVLLATSIPLFEWHINDVDTDFPPPYDVRVSTNKATTRWGEHLDKGSFRGKIYVSRDDNDCRYGDWNVILRRSQSDEAVEQLSINLYNEKVITNLQKWASIEIVLSIIYIWWFKIRYKDPSWKAIGLTIFAVFVFILSTQIVRPLLWTVGPSPDYFGTLDCYKGVVMLNVNLSNVHYEMPFVLAGGILLELTALWIMVRQVKQAVVERKIVPK